MKIWYHTLGCKVNQYETEKLRIALEKAGYHTAEDGAPFDIGIINSCAVTETAVAKTRAAVRKARETSPGAFIIAAGCAAGFCGGLPCDLAVPPEEKDGIPELVKQRFPVAEGPLSPALRERTRAVVKIQDGCSQFCSYCIIPYLRNRFSSADPAEVVEEVQALCRNGFCEIVLTGIRLGSYRAGGVSLEGLTELLLEKTDIRRIRLSSVEAWEITPGLVGLLSDSRMAKHLHIPLQSGSARVLKAMNRPYTPEQYESLIQNVRKQVPGIGVTTDVIAGFPGETEELFEEGLRFIEKTGFSRMHIFPFSPRRGTRAWDMPGQVDRQVKKERAARLRALAAEMQQRFADLNTGVPQEAIFENTDKNGFLRGYTSNYLEILTKRECPVNTPVTVTCREAKNGALIW